MAHAFVVHSSDWFNGGWRRRRVRRRKPRFGPSLTQPGGSPLRATWPTL